MRGSPGCASAVGSVKRGVRAGVVARFERPRAPASSARERGLNRGVGARARAGAGLVAVAAVVAARGLHAGGEGEGLAGLGVASEEL